MKFKLIIDDTREEEIVAVLHSRTTLADQIEALIAGQTVSDSIVGYTEHEWTMLAFADIACITVLNGKTYAIDARNRRYRLRQRLYELEKILPPSFIRINKSALANEHHLERFSATYSGGVDAVFKCGYTEYVSRRCFAEIRRRFDKK